MSLLEGCRLAKASLTYIDNKIKENKTRWVALPQTIYATPLIGGRWPIKTNINVHARKPCI